MNARTRDPGLPRVAAVALLLAVSACEATQPKARPYPTDSRAYDPILDLAVPAEPPEADAPSPPSAEAAPAPPPRVRIGDDTLYAFEFRDTPASDALRLIADRAGLNFVIPADATAPVSASLPQVTLDQALQVVLDHLGFDLVADGGVHSFRPRTAPGLMTRVYQPRTGDLTAIEPQLRAILGEEGLTINAQANVAYAVGTADKLGQVDELMRVIDDAPRQVLIEARILEVALDEGFEFGVAAALQDISLGDVSAEVLTNFVQESDAFSLVTLSPEHDFSAVLRALQSFGRLHVIASPRVLAVNQELAKIEIIEKVPYIKSTNTTSGSEVGVSTSSVEEVEFEEVGIRLHVTPVLGEGREILLKVTQDVSEVVDFFQSVPVTDSRNVDTRFVVKDRETIVIGGLLKERTLEEETGVPILMDLPWLGWLFTGTNTAREKVELVVLITPRIVRQGEVEGVTSEYKRELMNKSEEYRQGKYREFMDDVP